MPSLSENERQDLLNLARQAVIEAVSRGEILSKIPSGGIFSQRRGVFVTLHVGKRLRGCIGVVEPSEPLGESIVRCAASAALQDPRFPALRREELDPLRIQISLLFAPLPIRLEEIEIGSHRLLISPGDRRRLLLPLHRAHPRLSAVPLLSASWS